MSETSFDRAAINRENAQKSTGPITDADKRISSLNALRHGLSGQTVVMPSEDLAEYQRFAASLHADCKPVGALEIQLVQSLADDAWRLNRAKALETNLLTLGLHCHADAIVTDNPQVHAAIAIATGLAEHTKTLSALSMHQNRIARAFERNLTQLRQIQAERRERERVELINAGNVFLLHAKNNQVKGTTTPFDPAEHGFVFTAAEIEQYLRRTTFASDAYRANLKYHAAA